MLIKIDEIKGETFREIMAELKNNPELMDEIEGENLRGFDFLESLTYEIIADEKNEIWTEDLWNACR